MNECCGCFARYIHAVVATHRPQIANLALRNAKQQSFRTTSRAISRQASKPNPESLRDFSQDHDDRPFKAKHSSSDRHRATTTYKPSQVIYSDQAIAAELKYLRDPFKLAEHVKKQLDTLKNENKALALVRMSSRAGANIVSWNHIIDFQMLNGKVKAAFDTYNELKKRGLQPDSHTYNIMLRGLGTYSNYPNNAGRALSLYHSMIAPHSKAQANIMHVNSVLKVCARAGDLDSMWDIVARLPEKGPHAADRLTYSQLFGAFRSKIIRSSTQQDVSEEEQAKLREEMIQEGRKLWDTVIARWRDGDLQIDEGLVCAYGRVLLSGSRPKDWDEVFTLMQETMAVPRLLGRLGSSEGHVEAQSSEEEQLTILDKGQEKHYMRSSNRSGSAGKMKGTSEVRTNALSLALEACLKLGTKAGAKLYWDLLTSPDSFRVRPDQDNVNTYLQVLKRARSSAEALAVVRDDFPRLNFKLHAKSVRIAMSTCQRDINNPNVFATASSILDVVLQHHGDPDPTILAQYTDIAQKFIRDAEQHKDRSRALSLARDALTRLEPAIVNVRSYLSFGSAHADPARGDASQSSQLRLAAKEMLERVLGIYDTALRLAAGAANTSSPLLSPREIATLRERKASLSAFHIRLGTGHRPARQDSSTARPTRESTPRPVAHAVAST